jgi:hypothetical protein
MRRRKVCGEAEPLHGFYPAVTHIKLPLMVPARRIAAPARSLQP